MKEKLLMKEQSTDIQEIDEVQSEGYNIAQRFSRKLAELRGSDGVRALCGRTRAWLSVSGTRKAIFWTASAGIVAGIAAIFIKRGTAGKKTDEKQSSAA